MSQGQAMESLVVKDGGRGGGSGESPTPEVMADYTVLHDGLFFIFFVIFFSCIPMISLPGGLDTHPDPRPPLISSYLLALLFAVISSAFGMAAVMWVLTICYHTQLACIATLYSVVAMGSYFCLHLGFGILLLSMHDIISLSDFGISLTFAFAALSITFLTLYLGYFLWRSLKPSTVLLRTVILGSKITIGTYAIGFVLQCLALIFDTTLLARTAAVHVAVIFTTISMYRRGRLRLLL